MKRQNLIAVIAIIAVIIIAAIILANKIGGSKKEPQTNEIKQEEYTVESANGNKVNTSEALKKEREELGVKRLNELKEITRDSFLMIKQQHQEIESMLKTLLYEVGPTIGMKTPEEDENQKNNKSRKGKGVIAKK